MQVTRQPALIFDGDCRFCTSAARRAVALRRSPDDYAVLPYQRADLASLGLTESQCAEALQWVDAAGRVHSGPDAVAGLLRAGPRWARPLGRLIGLPGFHAAAGLAYRTIARNRHRLPGGTPTCSL